MQTLLLPTLLLLGCATQAPLPSGDGGADLSTPDGPSSTVDLTPGDPADLSSQPSPDLGGICGGFANIQCPNGFFCEIEDRSCGSADQSGHCLPRPQVCDKQYAPVCGCDGKTYGNDCERQSAGTSLSYEGICGCSTPCPLGQYCAQCKLSPACLQKGSICS